MTGSHPRLVPKGLALKDRQSVRCFNPTYPNTYAKFGYYPASFEETKSRKFSKTLFWERSSFRKAKMNVDFTDPSILLRWFSRTEYLCTFFLIFCLYAIRWDIIKRLRHSSCWKPFMNIQFWHKRTIDYRRKIAGLL